MGGAWCRQDRTEGTWLSQATAGCSRAPPPPFPLLWGGSPGCPQLQTTMLQLMRLVQQRPARLLTCLHVRCSTSHEQQRCTAPCWSRRVRRQLGKRPQKPQQRSRHLPLLRRCPQWTPPQPATASWRSCRQPQCPPRLSRLLTALQRPACLPPTAPALQVCACRAVLQAEVMQADPIACKIMHIQRTSTVCSPQGPWHHGLQAQLCSLLHQPPCLHLAPACPQLPQQTQQSCSQHPACLTLDPNPWKEPSCHVAQGFLHGTSADPQT